MDETHRTIRFAHRTLVAVSIAIIALSLGPNDADLYADALEEARALDELMRGEPREQFKTYLQRTTLEGPNKRSIGRLLPDSLVERDNQLRLDSERLPADSALTVGDFVYVPQPPAERSIQALYRFFKDSTAGRILPSGPIWNDIRIRTPFDCDGCTLRDLWIEESFSSWQARAFVVGRSYSDTISFRIIDKDTAWLQNWHNVGRDWLWAFVRQSDSVGRKWAQSWYDNPVLTDMRTGDRGIFPRLRRVWSEVKDLGVIESIALLQRRLNDEQSTLDLIGIRVSENAALVVGVPIFLGVLLVMLAHLTFLRSRLDGEPPQSELVPIFMFLPGKLSEAIVAFTLLVLPSTSLVLLFIRIDVNVVDDPVQFAIAAAATAAVFLVGAANLEVINKIRETHGFQPISVENANPQPPEGSTM